MTGWSTAPLVRSGPSAPARRTPSRRWSGRCSAGPLRPRRAAAKKTDVPALIKLIGHKNPRVAATAAEVLGRTGPHIAGAAVPELIAALDAKRHQWVRHQAAIALGKMGNAAKPAVPALTAALKDPDHALRVHAERSLERITGRPQEK